MKHIFTAPMHPCLSTYRVDAGSPPLLVLVLSSFLTFLLVSDICLPYCVYSGQEDSFILMLKVSSATNTEILHPTLCPHASETHSFTTFSIAQSLQHPLEFKRKRCVLLRHY